MSADLSSLFQLPPEEAVKYLEAKGYQLSWNWWEMQRDQYARAFTVAKVARLDILEDIRAAVETVLKEGKTERWFRQELEETLKRKGWWGKAVDVDPTTMEAQLYQAGSPRRLQTIYRTNLQTAYMAGRMRQFDAEKDRAPYWQYIAVLDAKTRPAHEALNGKVFRIDDPATDLIFPPSGFNCRCRARNLSERELQRRGLKVQTDVKLLERDAPGTPPVDKRTGETPAEWKQRGISIPDPKSPGDRITFYPDVGWDYNPGRAGLGTLEKLAAKKESSLFGARVRAPSVADAAQTISAIAIGAFVESALAARNAKQAALVVADIPGGFAASAEAAAEGLSVSGKSFALDHDYLLHIHDRHGGAAETARGQVPVTAADFVAIAAHLDLARDVAPGDPPRAKNGAGRIRATFVIGDFRLDVVFEVRRRVLVPVTIWKRPLRA